MITGLSHATLVVNDYDEAIKWYTEKVGLELRTDAAYGEGHRFVTVAVKGQDVEIVLHIPHENEGGEDPRAARGVHGFVFATDDCRKDVHELRERGVHFTQGPDDVPWGVQAVFEDLYGNTHVLVESPRQAADD